MRAVGIAIAASVMLAGCAEPPVDAALAGYIANIRAVDNHTHANTTVPHDSEADALPLDGIPPFALPARLRPENMEVLDAYRALYGYPHRDLDSAHVAELRATMQRTAREQGDKFPAWALDKLNVDVMLANRIAMGPGLAPPRFRWVSYVDALMLPLSTMAERTASPDMHPLYALEEKLLTRYLVDLRVSKLPPTLDAYVATVLTPTLERQRKAGCVAVKFEAAYLRPLNFDDVTVDAARTVYARYVGGGTPTHAEYKTLQDYLFRQIAREAGRLGMAVHIHALEGFGGYYRAAGGDPILLEAAFNDSTLRGTNFVIVHGGGIYASHAAAMMGKPNVYADVSAMAVIYPTLELSTILRHWLSQYPERVLFGTDAFAAGPDAGWEVAAWVGTNTVRRALAHALTGMMRDGEINRARAEQIATMVMRGNAVALYHLQ